MQYAVHIIAALDQKRGIGKKNDLLFRIPNDFKRMKELTINHPIIMGRKTFTSIGRVLPGRTNIIITRDSNYHEEGAIVVQSLDMAISKASESPGGSDIFIFGGGQIFSQAILENKVDILHLTVVKGDYGADTFFPDYSRFTTVLSQIHETSSGFEYTFLDLSK